MSKKQPDMETPREETAGTAAAPPGQEQIPVNQTDSQPAPESQAAVAELEKELEALKAQLAEQQDLLLRTLAEYDNYKKRTLREKDAATAFIRAGTVKALLPCYDGLERALHADSSSPEYAKGLELSLKQLMDGFCKLGLEEINPQGEPFNPEFHDAIMHVEDENYGESVVVEVLQKGYRIGDVVLRPAMVKVAN